MIYYKKLPFVKRAINKIKAIIKNPFVAVSTVLTKAPFKYILNDTVYLKIRYKGYTGRWLNLKNPIRFNEKLQWLKLHDKKALYSSLTDKHAVREYIKQQIGEEYLIPLIKVYNNTDEIHLNELPDQFALKCTHDSGSTIICEEKKQFNLSEAKKYLNKRLKRKYFYEQREYPYKNITPKIICEQLLSTPNHPVPEDYKVLCFHGKPKFIQVDLSRYEKHNRIMYDVQWKKAPFNIRFEMSPIEVERPAKLSEMLSIAEKLSGLISSPFVRIDLYQHNNKVYFGEITFFEEAGFALFHPDQYDFELGKLIDLSLVKN